ncbi:hypothetical protein [Streptomyces sp. 7-21]|uniref:hypothetical protein n=1 Tax=Streptomyces sp. 7-21 TaxID=2802283 RepID=UPI001920386C|nr:hypothetical protein [Streptomyces sp. 7-21]MBL1067384.1 hypothetical protein [Streptomyces sp. 7-21]
MQPSDGTGLPHTHAAPRHWLITAAALVAVTAVAALAGPSGASASPEPEPGPDPDQVSYPMDCGPLEPVVTDHASVDFDGDGRAETVAAVRCDAGSGTPPHGVYLLTHAAEGETPRVAETLVDPEEGMTVETLTAGESEVTLRLLGYSSADVPRCCPDMQREVAWVWQDGRLELRPAPASPSI